VSASVSIVVGPGTEIAVAANAALAAARPQLVFFYSETSGPCRRFEAFLSQVLQRRQNHETFQLVRVSAEEHPELHGRFGVDRLPTFFVVEGRLIRARIAGPKGRRELEEALNPWLR
jgi:thioredoxin-like negative regulator of GroEL